jgi:hypothetical protein
MYRSFVRKGGAVVFHDICLFPEEWGNSTAVGAFWREIAPHYNTREIIDPHGTAKREKGPGERWKWGIGVVKL